MLKELTEDRDVWRREIRMVDNSYSRWDSVAKALEFILKETGSRKSLNREIA